MWWTWENEEHLTLCLKLGEWVTERVLVSTCICSSYKQCNVSYIYNAVSNYIHTVDGLRISPTPTPTHNPVRACSSTIPDTWGQWNPGPFLIQIWSKSGYASHLGRNWYSQDTWVHTELWLDTWNKTKCVWLHLYMYSTFIYHSLITVHNLSKL